MPAAKARTVATVTVARTACVGDFVTRADGLARAAQRKREENAREEEEEDPPFQHHEQHAEGHQRGGAGSPQGATAHFGGLKGLTHDHEVSTAHASRGQPCSRRGGRRPKDVHRDQPALVEQHLFRPEVRSLGQRREALGRPFVTRSAP